MQIIEDRRALHRIPELGYQLPETLAYVRASLEKLSCAVFSPIEGAVCAFFDFGRESAVAFRAEEYTPEYVEEPALIGESDLIELEF